MMPIALRKKSALLLVAHKVLAPLPGPSEQPLLLTYSSTSRSLHILLILHGPLYPRSHLYLLYLQSLYLALFFFLAMLPLICYIFACLLTDIYLPTALQQERHHPLSALSLIQ